jgi:D-arabinose 1-dehydrogenase-like Zn-dependent alcohol dehydrogenase
MSIEFTTFKGSANDGIVESKTYHNTPTGNQVLVKITHSGICGTDEHYKHVDMVLGHEGVGTVEQIGESVSQFKVGDIVGWGYQHTSCGQCEQCLLGRFHVHLFYSVDDLVRLFRPRPILPEQ